MAYTARPVKICYTYVNADNSTPEKGNVRRIVRNSQAHIAAACEFSIFPARPCCRRNKEKERKQSNAQKKLWKRSAAPKSGAARKADRKVGKFFRGSSLFS